MPVTVVDPLTAVHEPQPMRKYHGSGPFARARFTERSLCTVALRLTAGGSGMVKEAVAIWIPQPLSE